MYNRKFCRHKFSLNPLRKAKKFVVFNLATESQPMNIPSTILLLQMVTTYCAVQCQTEITQNVWAAFVGKELPCQRVPPIFKDPFVVTKDGLS